jgi:hypothetical protein
MRQHAPTRGPSSYASSVSFDKRLVLTVKRAAACRVGRRPGLPLEGLVRVRLSRYLTLQADPVTVVSLPCA